MGRWRSPPPRAAVPTSATARDGEAARRWTLTHCRDATPPTTVRGASARHAGRQDRRPPVAVDWTQMAKTVWLPMLQAVGVLGGGEGRGCRAAATASCAMTT
ncbi:hypothetical protein BU14_2227s0001 [Porphyra umbilicalis]|uniref:Uncharacterized protein n=1 Tax=Porphyra umbilicalis TaxID=2786 RepID=A0A1X6NJL7_PORUM|nr:hypothetical protein BU14_2227s0001 [Porphyra umbilicalis]|eukprot:OSX68798.1 hypothetical protein BU14_2227s0001 [Porphyra umbilicalis]